MASVTVIIPVFNEEPVIGQVVRDVRKTIGDQNEVLVIDDGSTDKTAEVAKRAGA
ncbi:MAG: glycosyltransferase family 2 protein, partial [Nitrospiria bacterium]